VCIGGVSDRGARPREAVPSFASPLGLSCWTLNLRALWPRTEGCLRLRSSFPRVRPARERTSKRGFGCGGWLA